MDTALQQLTQKLFDEGIAAGERQAKDIVEKAESEANSIVTQAQQQAQKIIDDARQQAHIETKKNLSEMELASQKVVNTLKQRIEELITLHAIEKNMKSTLDSVGFLQKLILTIAQSWEAQDIAHLKVQVANQHQEAITTFIKQNAYELLEKGLTIEGLPGEISGFVVAAKDQRYKVSFTEESFVAFLRTFLRDSTRSVVFGSNGGGQ